MNEPVTPRQRGGSYACWIKNHQREADATSYDYLNWRATPRHAALSFAEDLVDHGRHPELVGKPLEVLRPRQVDGSLTTFSIDWEFEPTPFISCEEQVEAHRAGVRYG